MIGTMKDLTELFFFFLSEFPLSMLFCMCETGSSSGWAVTV